MEDIKKTKLTDEALDNVAGGTTSFAEQAEIVPTAPLILLHPDARPEEDEGTGTVPGIMGRL